jgi:hypothetical protein
MALDLVWSPFARMSYPAFRLGHQGLLRATFGVRGILCNLEEYHSDLPILKNAQSHSNMRPNAFLALRRRDLERLHPPWYGGAMFASPVLLTHETISLENFK